MGVTLSTLVYQREDGQEFDIPEEFAAARGGLSVPFSFVNNSQWVFSASLSVSSSSSSSTTWFRFSFFVFQWYAAQFDKNTTQASGSLLA